jgi:hypothetical protein
MAWDDNPRRNRYGKLRAKKPKKPRRRMTYAQHAAQGKQRIRGGNGKVYYGARGQAGLHRRNRKRKKSLTSTANSVKYPHLGRSRTSSVSSSYTKPKAKPKAAPPAAKTTPKPKPEAVRSVVTNALEHYAIRSLIGSDVAYDGLDPYVYNDAGYPGDVDLENPEYTESFNLDSLNLGISDLSAVTTWTERYANATPVYDAVLDLPNTSAYSSIQVRIVEL